VTDTTQPGMETALGERLKQEIRDIPDFPQPGIIFRDITPLLANAATLKTVIDAMAAPYENIDQVVIIESRGFILGTPIAYLLGAGVVPVRKPGRLPARTLSEQYELEYGANSLEIHYDAITEGQRVLIVDDLLATGGTVRATINLIERLGGEVAGVAVLAELSALNGRARQASHDVRSLVIY
jgi:adenine phosphoribosyltransferase